jgi:hypothetical protein
MVTKSFVQKQEECKGRKLSEERISVPLCISATSEKTKLLAVGNAVQPCMFKAQLVDTILLHGVPAKRYGYWISITVCEEWLTDLNSTMNK